MVPHGFTDRPKKKIKQRFIHSEGSIDFLLSVLPSFLLVCRAAGGEVGQPVQGDVCGPTSQQPRGIPLWRLQFNSQGLGFSQQQGQTY